MYRKPQIKDQARILAQEFEAHGIKLAHRQALDVLARVNGHASWHVMREYEKKTGASTAPTPSTAVVSQDPLIVRVVPKPGPIAIPAWPAKKEAPDSLKRYCFEAMGFVSSRETLDNIVSHETPPLSPEILAKLQEFGFLRVENVSLSEDDEQDDEDIKVFVSVYVIGPASLYPSVHYVDYELSDLLDSIGVTECCGPDGEDCVGAENWELVDTDDL